MTFDISIDRVQKFYEALGKCIEEWNTNTREELKQEDLDFDPKHPDEAFFIKQNIDTSIDYWLTVIETRMALEAVSYFSSPFNPFVSCDLYTANTIWFELAFDIQKILNNPKKTWFSICFPNLNHFDPITFRSLLHVMPSHVYVVKKLFDVVSNVKWIAESEMIKIYFPKAYSPNPCYVFEEKTSQLYHFIPDPNPERASQGEMIKVLISVDTFHKQRFAEGLAKHLQYSRKRLTTKTHYHDEKNSLSNTNSFVMQECSLLSSISEDFIGESAEMSQQSQFYRKELFAEDREADCYVVDSRHLEKLVTDHGGYPDFDLRRFILNHTRSRIYFLASLLYPRQALNAYCAEDDTVSHLNVSSVIQRNRAGEIIPLSDKTRPEVYRTKPHHYASMYAEKNAIRPAPFTLIDLHNMIWKRGALFLYQQNTLHVHPQNYIGTVLMPTWRERGRVPKLILPRLLQTFLVYFQLLDTDDSPQAFHLLLNEWSSDRWRNRRHFYPWNEDELQDRLFLYTQNVLMEVPSTTPFGQNTFVQLLLNCLHSPLNKIYGEVLNLGRWIAEYAPHFVSSNPHFDSVYENLGVARYFNVAKFIFCLEELKPTANGDLLFLLKNFIYQLKLEYKNRLDSLFIDAKHLNELKVLYKMHDDYVSTNRKYDHVKALNYEQAAWRRLAETLSGAEWIEDSIELLCPTVEVRVEPNIRMPLAAFDPQELVFTKNRKALIALGSSRRYCAYTQFFANCTKRDSPTEFTFEELNAVQEADPRYHAFGLKAYQTYGGEPLSLSTCLMVRFLIDRTFEHRVLDAGEPNFVKERYSIKQVDRIDTLFTNKKSNNTLFKTLSSFFPPASPVSPTIYVMLTKEGIQCVIQDNPKLPPKNIGALFKDLGIPRLKRQAISSDNLNQYYANIRRYLEKKGHITPYYSPMWRSSCVTGEKIFFNFYHNMPPRERAALDRRVIEVDNVRKTFKQILKQSHLSRAVSGVFLMALLISIDPDFVFNLNPLQNEIDEKATGAEEKLRSIFLNWREASYRLPYKDIRNDIEVVFISLMTTDFAKDLPEDEEITLEWLLDDIVYHGCTNKIPRTLLAAFMPVLGEEDSAKQEKLYIDTLKTTIYSIFYKSYTEFRSESNLIINQNTHQWVRLLISNHLRYFVKIRDYDWLQAVYLNIKPSDLSLTEEPSEKFATFHNELKEFSDFSSGRLMVNIKYIYFLKKLSANDFLQFWTEIDAPYRKEVLIDYVASYGRRMDGSRLTSTAQEIFADYLEDMPMKKSMLNLQKSISSFDTLTDHLMTKAANLYPSSRKRTSSSPWF